MTSLVVASLVVSVVAMLGSIVEESEDPSIVVVSIPNVDTSGSSLVGRVLETMPVDSVVSVSGLVLKPSVVNKVVSVVSTVDDSVTRLVTGKSVTGLVGIVVKISIVGETGTDVVSVIRLLSVDGRLVVVAAGGAVIPTVGKVTR